MTETLPAILAATLASGILDATAASLQAALTLKVKPHRVFQGGPRHRVTATPALKVQET